MAFGSTFLEYPELFPARCSGEPWGEEHVTLHFAGGPYSFHGLDPAQSEAVRTRFAELCGAADPLPGATTTQVFRIAETDFVPIDLRGWDYTLDMEHDPAAVRVAGLGFMGRLDLGPPLTAGMWTCRGDDAFRGILENFFRVLVSYRLLSSGGLLVHSAAVVDRGAAYLLLGRSGAGKTTISRLAQEAGLTVLSDDMNALSMTRDGPFVERLPFAGDLGQTAARSDRYPLRALLRLTQGVTMELSPLSRGVAFATLLSCAPYVNADPHRYDALAATIESVLQAIPVRLLRFPPRRDLWSELTEALGPAQASFG